MTQDEVIRIAREAGFVYRPEDEHVFEVVVAGLERFAALFAAAEREACAKVCDEIAHELGKLVGNIESGIALGCSTAIRARGES
jgi:hypothetical protein